MINDDSGMATVQTLAAEVRVLVIGKRQVTTGIVRQLDRVNSDGIEPFGRVDGPTVGNHSRDSVFVVGRDKATGALVRSSVHVATSPERHATWLALPLIVLASR